MNILQFQGLDEFHRAYSILHLKPISKRNKLIYFFKLKKWYG